MRCDQSIDNLVKCYNAKYTIVLYSYFLTGEPIQKSNKYIGSYPNTYIQNHLQLHSAIRYLLKNYDILLDSEQLCKFYFIF